MFEKLKKLDGFASLVPLLSMSILGGLLWWKPQEAQTIMRQLRAGLSQHFSWFYLALGLVTLLATGYVAFSRYGRIRLGRGQPVYSNVKWGMMIFTATMSADLIFYALTEWAMYAAEGGIEGSLKLWSLTYSFFHWGPIAWSFYLSLAAAFGFMLHVRQRPRQQFAEALRPLLGDLVDGWVGRGVNLLAIFALLAGSATTFSVSLPLLAHLLGQALGWENEALIAVGLLLVVALLYTTAVLLGMGAVTRLATLCASLLGLLLVSVFLGGGAGKFMVSNSWAAGANVLWNFFPLALGKHSDMTAYYWSYWMVWCTATPFFIATISRGRTLRQVILGGYSWGLAGTGMAFGILGNYGLYHFGGANLSADHLALAQATLARFPLSDLLILVLGLTMIGMYATVFESLTLVVARYSYRYLAEGRLPSKQVQVFWAITLMILPLALLFMQQSVYSLQSLAMLMALPIGGVILLIMLSFFKDARAYLREEQDDERKDYH
ncbi:BCCT family transporter [Ligilactobacillus equi]|uniref:Choline/carnitine/betaine transporter n=1 Tax=Ligilactobacillus equi DPC 6820 TaxID=1392007 RepID=V7I0B4_9LACO|nr:BCCT family transporter [Ligilactobacillus equi]ETA74985.1 choline/carnitine/betaine transporter [Ligilactobacillus equi DPC 6820]